jgi:hypothetical protein
MTAAEEYLEADDRYDGTGVKLQQQVVEQLEPYYDSSAGRAPIVRQFARQLAFAIKEFSSSRASLSSHVATLQIARIQRQALLGAEGIFALGQAAQKQASEAAANPYSSREFDIRELDSLDRLVSAIEAEVTLAVRVSAALIGLREAALQDYFDEVPHVSGKTIIGKVSRAVAEEGALKSVEMGIEALAKLVGAAAPIASAGVGLYQACKDVRDKVKSLEAHYERSALDSMFEFAERISDEQDLFDAVIELLKEVQRFTSEAKTIST